jgi:hypothetical protein
MNFLDLDFGKMRMRIKWILPGSCAAHKMGRKSAYFRVHAHVHLAGSGGMRMSLTLIGYGKIVFFVDFERRILEN